jgi:hypothetical protein
MNPVLVEVECMTKTEIDRLRRLMPLYIEEHGMSQGELGALVGVKANTISTFIGGGLKRPGSWLQAFADMLGEWEPTGGLREDPQREDEFAFDSDRILDAITKAVRSGRKELVDELTRLSVEVDDLRKRSIRAKRKLESIVARIESGDKK